MSKHSVKAVILAAGRGTRMLPLTKTCPKPLQTVLGKNLIEWKLEALPYEVTDVVIVIGHQGEQIQKFFGALWKGKHIQYVVQKELNGTAGALLAAKPLLHERFLVMMGDDLYDQSDIAKLMKLDWGVCVTEVHNRTMKGEILVDEHDHYIGIDEDVHLIANGLANTGLYMLREEILDIAPVGIGGISTEYGLPHTLAVIAENTTVHIVKTKNWMQITTPEDLLRAESFVKA